MNRNWQPGDVAVATRHDGTTSRAIRRNDGTWRATDSCINNPPHNFRPLVVIDVEDREQVERLAKAMHESDHIAPWHDLHNETRRQMEDALQAALRSLITPPRPEEPTGLGAVVEDDAGFLWVSFHSASTGIWWRDRGGQDVRWDRMEITSADQIKSQGWSE